MKKTQLIAIWIAMLSCWGCSDKCDDKLGDYDDGTEQVYFDLRWQPTPNNWQPAIGAFGYIHQDSVKLYNESYTLVDDFVANVGGQCFFTIVDKTTPREEDILRQYYLYLSRQDTDTIRVEFKLKKDDCNNVMYYGKFFYNNKLISQNENISFNLGGTIIK